MREMWRVHGVTERPYAPADIEAALARVTGDPAFARDWFASIIEGSDLPDFAPLLAQAGIVILPANPAAAWAGAVRLPATGAPVIAAPLAPDTPLYAAGLDRGDQIVAVGDRVIAGQADWTAALASAKPGDEVPIRFLQRGVERSATLRFATDPSFNLVRAEAGGGSVPPEQLAFREAWLGAPTE